jgi:hypothetical protein
LLLPAAALTACCSEADTGALIVNEVMAPAADEDAGTVTVIGTKLALGVGAGAVNAAASVPGICTDPAASTTAGTVDEQAAC